MTLPKYGFHSGWRPFLPQRNRFWPIQWAETGIYLALALALAGFCYWRLGRRLP